MQTPNDIPLTLEDLALIADGTGNIPDDTAARLQAFFNCDDSELLEAFWRWKATQLEELHQMAADAGVELLADGLYAHRCLERLRTEPWDTPGELFDPRLDVPFQELIAMAGVRADRAEGEEAADLRQLIERLIVALGRQVGGDEFVELLIGRLLEVGETVAEEALRQLVGRYHHRRAAAAG